jgi:uncharacterized protein YdcH (DUF465 family)
MFRLVEKEGRLMNAAEAQEVKSLLLQNHDQYRELAEQHHQLDDRLHKLTEKHYLSTSEQFEEVTLKKRKLALKDRMEEIAREYARGRLS